jgi:hypothetical protein
LVAEASDLAAGFVAAPGAVVVGTAFEVVLVPAVPGAPPREMPDCVAIDGVAFVGAAFRAWPGCVTPD